jgi:arylsulfatase A-like enzyme
VAYIDDQIGRLIRKLRDLGLYDNTLIIVTGDHGEALGDRGLIGHGLSVYQNQVRVPLIVKVPGKASHRLITETVSHVDIFPTIMEAVGIEPSRSVQGKSLLQTNSDRPVFTESFANPLLGAIPAMDRIERAIYVSSYKLVESTKGTHELYNLVTDPDETWNRCILEAERCSNLTVRLDQWIRSVP